MKKRLTATFLCLIYLAILIKIMVFKDVPLLHINKLTLDFAGVNGGHPANFIPFKTILPYLFGEKGFIIGGLNLFGNIALLIPLGFLAPLVYPKLTWKKSLVLAVLSGLAIETMQTILNVGIFDIDDVILNALGFMVGFWVVRTFARWYRSRKYLYIALSIGIVFFITAAIGAYTALSLYRDSQRAVTIEDLKPQEESKETEGGLSASNDPCGGTGGTGQIVSKDDHSITIQSKRGSTQVIGIGEHTKIKNSNGKIQASELQVGDHVTIVIFDDKTATDILVCNAK